MMLPRTLLPFVLLSACLGLGACADGGSAAPEVPPVDTAADTTEPPDTYDSALPEIDPETEVSGPDVVADTGPVGPQNPFEYEDPSPPFLPADPPLPEPLGCPAITNAVAEVGDLTGWSVLEGTFIATGTSADSYAGGFEFRAGTSERSRLGQEVDVSSFLAGLTGGEARIATLRVFVRGDDAGSLKLSALDASGTVLATRANGPYLNGDWREGEVALALPAGTQRIRLELVGDRLSGDDNEAYFDDAELCLYDRWPPAIIADLPGPPYLMNVRPDGVSVLFETRARTGAAVDYGTSPDHLDQTVTVPELATTHVVRLTGLTPFTRYYYRVRYADLALPPYDFLTARAPDDPGRIELIMLGDNQDGPRAFRDLSRQMAALDPDFILHAGDVVQTGTRTDYRETFFSPLFGLGNRAAMVMAPGNHETYGSGILTSNESRALWDEYVDQPNDEHCFGFRWGQLFVMVIDTERPHAQGTPQYACIEDTLASEAAQSAMLRVALFHRPPLVEYWDPVAGVPSETAFFTFDMDAPDVRYYLAPLLQRARVELVFNGHNHMYQFVPRWPEFTAWVTSGGGGGTLEGGSPESRVNDWSPFITRQIFGRYHFLRVIVQDGLMWVRAIGDRGDVLDEFQIAR